MKLGLTVMLSVMMLSNASVGFCSDKSSDDKKTVQHDLRSGHRVPVLVRPARGFTDILNLRQFLEHRKYPKSRQAGSKGAENRRRDRRRLENLIGKERSGKKRQVHLFRLAENYVEEANDLYIQLRDLDKNLEGAKEKGDERLRTEIESRKKLLWEKEDKWRGKAISIYKTIVGEFPNFENRDKVIFYLASSLWDIERYEESLEYYKQVIEHHPKSEYAPDAYLALGEYFFEQAKLHDAMAAYKNAAKFKSSRIYPYAIYKLGWCYYNLREWEKAKSMFRSLVLRKKKKGNEASARLSSSSDASVSLSKEALNDFVMAYSRAGSAEDALRVFNRLSPEDSHDMMVQLAGFYFEYQQCKDAISTYSYLIEKEKCSAEVPFYQSRIVECSSMSTSKQDTVRQVRKLVDLLFEVEKCVKEPSSGERGLGWTRERVEGTLQRLVNAWVDEAIKDKDRKTLGLARDVAESYLALFPGSPGSAGMVLLCWIVGMAGG